MFNRLSLLFLLAAVCGSSHLAHADCETTKLPFQPYSSSYLPKKKGRLTNPDPDPWHSDPRPNIELTPEQMESWSKLTLMQKLDSLDEYILGRKTYWQEEVESSHHNSSRAAWEGYCHQWSSAALDPEVEEYLKNTPDATICGNTVITKGEIKEMFTGFYAGGDSKSWTGKRINHQLSIDEQASFADNGDLYSPSSFDQHIQDSLKKGQGVVINVTKAAEVWNQPAYQSDRCESPLPINQDIIGKMNPCMLQARDKDVNLWLKDLCDTDGLTFDRNFDSARDYQSPELKDNAKAEALQLEVLSSKLSMRNQKASYTNEARVAAQRVAENEGSLYAAREASRSLIMSLAKAGEIHQSDLGLTAVEVRNTIHYGLETGYAGPETLAGTSRYEYVLFKNAEGKVVGSEWETDVKKRPGFVWEPTRIKSEDWGQPLRDLLAVLDRCKENPEFRTQNKESMRVLQEAIRGASAPM